MSNIVCYVPTALFILEPPLSTDMLSLPGQGDRSSEAHHVWLSK